MNGQTQDTRLLGRIAIITGSSSGIGRAIAIKYASAGARIVCADLKPTARPVAAAAKTAPKPTHELIIANHGSDTAIFFQTNVGHESEIESLIEAAVKWGGRLDIMVNNAGIASDADNGLGSRIHECPTTDYDRTHLINNRAVWIGCKHAIIQMLKQDPMPANARGERTRGWIINTASMLGLVGIRGAPCYVPAKHAVVGMTKQIAIDYARDRIHVNALCPGFVKSAMIEDLLLDGEAERGLAEKHPWASLGRPEDVADAALFLASDEA